MGFSSILYTIPKKEKDTYNKIEQIEEVLDYQSCENKLEKLSLSDYLDRTFQNPEKIAESDLSYYRQFFKENEYGIKTLKEEYAYWGSIGCGKIHDYLSQIGEEVREGDCVRIYTKEDLIKVSGFFIKNIKKCLPKEGNINYAYKYISNNEDKYEDEESDILLSKCDGVMIEFIENHNKELVDTTGKYGDNILICDKGVCWEELDAYMEGLDGCIKILTSDNLDSKYIVYAGGW